MVQKKYVVTDIGEITLAKRRGAKSLRLSVSRDGSIRVSMPAWLPYNAGLVFATRQKDWIVARRLKYSVPLLYDGAIIGKSHRLVFKSGLPAPGAARSYVRQNNIIITSDYSLDNPKVQRIAYQACEAALIKEAKLVLPKRLSDIAHAHGFKYKKVAVKKMSSRWGSCSSKANINLNSYLMQLPWELIDYVLLHELAHTKVPNHSVEFWNLVSKKMPKYRQLRKRIGTYSPSIMPITGTA